MLFKPSSCNFFAKTKLMERGVEVLLDSGVRSFDGKQVFLENLGYTIKLNLA